jgi:hypothetical protein
MKYNLSLIIILLIIAFISLAVYNGWLIYESFVSMVPKEYTLPSDIDVEYNIPLNNETHSSDEHLIPQATSSLNFPYVKISDKKYKRSIPSSMYRLNTTTAAILPIGDNVTPAPIDKNNNLNIKWVPNGYYIVDFEESPGNKRKMIAKVPSGFVSNDKINLIPVTKTAMYSMNSKKNDSAIDMSGNVSTRYDMDNLDVTYHDDPADIVKKNELIQIDFGTKKIIGPDGTPIDYTYVGNMPMPTYYQPGSFQMGASTYVPNYESSVYLSRLTGQSTTRKIYDSASQKSGFCETYDIDKQGVEEKCNKLDVNTCASTKCCVLLGGSKCVAGNENGPVMKANYSDPFIENKDYYYYNGKCYGYCT